MVPLGSAELMVLAVMLSALPTLLACIDIARKRTTTWKAAGHSQILWLVLVFAFPFLGALAYWAIVRRDLAATHAGMEAAMA